MNRRFLAVTAAAAVLALAGAAVAGPPAGPRSVTPVFVGWNPSPSLKRGVDLWANAEKARALEAFHDAVKECPRDPVAWHNLGIALLHFSRTVPALEAFRHERFLSPDSPGAYFAMGECLMVLGQYPEAENSFVMAVVQFPGEWRYWEALARAFKMTHKDESALIAQRNADRLRPRFIPQFRGFDGTTRDILRTPSSRVPIPWINWSNRH